MSEEVRMREYSPLKNYPSPKEPRHVGSRTIQNKIIASYRDERYYDGDRCNGYGGFKYDGRWKEVVQAMVDEYHVNEASAVLQMGCEKGFLLHDFHERFPSMKVKGAEMSDYAIAHAMPSLKQHIIKTTYSKLPFHKAEFDFVIAIGVIYTLTLADAISALKEIQRVGKGRSFITLGAYTDEETKRLFTQWSVLGSTILHVNDWLEVLKHVGYTGDYAFATAKTLHLVE